MTVQWSNVGATYDRNPPNYTQGETIGIDATATAVDVSEPITEQINDVVITFTAQPTGEVNTITAPVASITHPGASTPQTVSIAVTGGGRTWTVTGMHASATA